MALQFILMYAHHLRHIQCVLFPHMEMLTLTITFNPGQVLNQVLVLLFPVNITVKPTLIAITVPTLSREEHCHIVTTYTH